MGAGFSWWERIWINLLSVAGFIKHLDPWGDKEAVVVEGAAADQVAVDDARFVDEDAAADFEVEFTFGDGGHLSAADTVSVGRDLDAVADAATGFVGVEHGLGDADKVFVVTDVLRGAAAAEEDAEVVVGVDFAEGDIGLDLVAFPFAGDGPARSHFMHDHLVLAFFRGGDHGEEAGFLEAVVGVEGVDGFGGIAYDDEDFVLGVGLGFGMGFHVSVIKRWLGWV